jgi:uncharacterized protein (DUF1684 family)
VHIEVYDFILEVAMQPGRILLISAALTAAAALTTAILRAADPAYLKKIEAFRKQHEADYRRDYVPLSGLFYLSEGRNTAGSDRSHKVQLPSRTPANVGTFLYQGGRVRFEPQPGANVTLRGKPVTSPLELNPSGGDQPADELTIGDVAFWVHPDGNRRAIRLRDPQSDTARSFKGFRWFPIDERYRAVGRFIRDPAPRTVKIAILSGGEQDYTTEGVVEFTMSGQTIRLRPMTSRPGRFFFIFRDATSGKQTYEAARFLYSDLNADGTVVMDFNEAYNPPCAFNPYTTCPLPLPENRLSIALLAGEMDYQK